MSFSQSQFTSSIGVIVTTGPPVLPAFLRIGDEWLAFWSV